MCLFALSCHSLIGLIFEIFDSRVRLIDEIALMSERKRNANAYLEWNGERGSTFEWIISLIRSLCCW